MENSVVIAGWGISGGGRVYRGYTVMEKIQLKVKKKKKEN